MAKITELPTANAPRIGGGSVFNPGQSVIRRFEIDTTPVVDAVQLLEEKSLKQLQDRALIAARERGRNNVLDWVAKGGKIEDVQINEPHAQIRNRAYIYEAAAEEAKLQTIAQKLFQEDERSLEHMANTYSIQDANGRRDKPDQMDLDAAAMLEARRKLFSEIDPTGRLMGEAYPQFADMFQKMRQKNWENYEQDKRLEMYERGNAAVATAEWKTQDKIRKLLLQSGGYAKFKSELVMTKRGFMEHPLVTGWRGEALGNQAWLLAHVGDKTETLDSGQDRIYDQAFKGAIDDALEIGKATGDYATAIALVQAMESDIREGKYFLNNKTAGGASDALDGAKVKFVDIFDEQLSDYTTQVKDSFGSQTTVEPFFGDINNIYNAIRNAYMVLPVEAETATLPAKDKKTILRVRYMVHHATGRIVNAGGTGIHLDLTQFNLKGYGLKEDEIGYLPIAERLQAGQYQSVSTEIKNGITVGELLSAATENVPPETLAWLKSLEAKFGSGYAVKPFGDGSIEGEWQQIADKLNERVISWGEDCSEASRQTGHARILLSNTLADGRQIGETPSVPLAVDLAQARQNAASANSNDSAYIVQSVQNNVYTHAVSAGATAAEQLTKNSVPGDTGEKYNQYARQAAYNVSFEGSAAKALVDTLILAEKDPKGTKYGRPNDEYAIQELNRALAGLAEGRNTLASYFAKENGVSAQSELLKVQTNMAYDERTWAKLAEAAGGKGYLVRAARVQYILNQYNAPAALNVQEYVSIAESNRAAVAAKKFSLGEDVIKIAKTISSGNATAASLANDEIADMIIGHAIKVNNGIENVGTDQVSASGELIFGPLLNSIISFPVNGLDVHMRLSPDFKSEVGADNAEPLLEFALNSFAVKGKTEFQAFSNNLHNSTPTIEKENGELVMYFYVNGRRGTLANGKTAKYYLSRAYMAFETGGAKFNVNKAAEFLVEE